MNKFKKILSLILIMVMIFSMCTVCAFAEDNYMHVYGIIWHVGNTVSYSFTLDTKCIVNFDFGSLPEPVHVKCSCCNNSGSVHFTCGPYKLYIKNSAGNLVYESDDYYSHPFSYASGPFLITTTLNAGTYTFTLELCDTAANHETFEYVLDLSWTPIEDAIDEEITINYEILWTEGRPDSAGIELTWNKIEGATNYAVYRSVGATGHFEHMKDSGGNRAVDWKVKQGQKYSYYVRVLDEDYNVTSIKSNIITVTYDKNAASSGTTSGNTSSATGTSGTTSSSSGNTSSSSSGNTSGTTTEDIKSQLPEDGIVAADDITVSLLEEAVDAEVTLTVETEDIQLELDTTTLQTLYTAANGASNLEFIFKKVTVVDAASLNDQQKNAIKGLDIAACITAEIFADGRVISEDFGGGKITAKIPFTPPEGVDGNEFSIIYIDEDGNFTPIETTYENNTLVAEFEHFSDYAIVQTSSLPTEADLDSADEPGSTPALVYGILAALVVAGVGGIYVYKKKKQS